MLKRNWVKLVGGILLAGVIAVLPACGGTTQALSAPGAAAKAGQSAPTAVVSLPASPVSSGDSLAKGKLIYEKTAGGVGCASCHGLDGKGNKTVGAPDNRGATEEKVRAALINAAMMNFIKLTDEEITAVVEYLHWLATQP